MKLVTQLSDPTTGCRVGYECPQIWLNDEGQIVVVGQDVTSRVRDLTGVAQTEGAVVISRELLAQAVRKL